MNQDEPGELLLRFDKLVYPQKISATHEIWKKKILSHFLALSIMVKMFLEKWKWPSSNHLTIIRTISRSRGALPQMRFTDSEKGSTTTSTKSTTTTTTTTATRLQLLTPSTIFLGQILGIDIMDQECPRPPSNNAAFMTAFINKRESWIRQ